MHGYAVRRRLNRVYLEMIIYDLVNMQNKHFIHGHKSDHMMDWQDATSKYSILWKSTAKTETNIKKVNQILGQNCCRFIGFGELKVSLLNFCPLSSQVRCPTSVWYRHMPSKILYFDVNVLSFVFNPHFQLFYYVPELSSKVLW